MPRFSVSSELCGVRGDGDDLRALDAKHIADTHPALPSAGAALIVPTGFIHRPMALPPLLLDARAGAAARAWCWAVSLAVLGCWRRARRVRA
jgi:hypothetical protein